MKCSNHLLGSSLPSLKGTKVRRKREKLKAGERGGRKEKKGEGANNSSCGDNFLLGCHGNKVSLGGGAMSVRRHPIRSRCSKRMVGGSQQIGRADREREKEVGLSISTLVFWMICQLFYKLFPCFLLLLLCQVSVAPEPTQTKPKA